MQSKITEMGGVRGGRKVEEKDGGKGREMRGSKVGEGNGNGLLKVKVNVLICFFRSRG